MWELQVACVCVRGRKIRERDGDGAMEIERDSIRERELMGNAA